MKGKMRDKLERLRNYFADLCIGCYADCKSCFIGYIWQLLEGGEGDDPISD